MTIPVRLHRSELCVPGTNMRMLEKAPGLGADVVMLDLEDAVAPDDKPSARENVIEALRELDWGGCCVSVRINGLDTHYCYRDIVDVVEQSGRFLDTVLVPKVASAGDIHLVATLLDQIEEAVGIEKPIGITALIETAPEW
jgi:Citrate lyase beta subunit